MPLPNFDANGVLPPTTGTPTNPDNISPYPSVPLEFGQRFGSTLERRRILSGWLHLRALLRQAGFGAAFQWVDGSFLEDIEQTEQRAPRDVDVITFYWPSAPDFTPRVLGRLRRFFKVLAEAHAALRLESGDLIVRLDHDRVAEAADRVAAVETKPEKLDLAGQFRGATLDTWRFDFRTAEGQSISGRLADDVPEDAAGAMNRFTNQDCVAKFNRIRVIARGSVPTERYELLSLSAIPPATPR